MSSEVSTKYLSESDFDKWRDFVIASPQGTIYSLPEYLDTLCIAVGGRFRLLAVLQKEEIVGGVALYENDTRFGPYLSPRLLLFYNGLLLREYATKYPSQSTSRHLKIQSALESELSKTRYASLLMKNHNTITDVRLFMQKGWQALPSYTYVVPIADLSCAWSRIEQNLRRLVKRCEQQDMPFTEDDDFDSFYRMHTETHERKGAPLYMPYDDFKKFFVRLRDLQFCRLYHARLPNGKSVSAQLVLTGPCSMTHTVSAAADEEYLNTGATAYLRWKAFEHLSGLGYRCNDLTDASLNPVTRFKSQLGGDLITCLVLSRPEMPLFRANRVIREFLNSRKFLQSNK